jgi:hypothetical protein
METTDVDAGSIGGDETGTVTTDDKVIEFTDREMMLILKSLPENTDPERKQQLADNLRAWGKYTVPIHFRAWSLRLYFPREHAAKVARDAARLYDEVDRLGPTLRPIIGAMLAMPNAQRPPWWWAQEGVIAAGQQQLEQVIDVLRQLRIAAERAEGGRDVGQPPAFLPMVLVNDLAVMFQKATGQTATRVVDSTTPDGDYDKGSFYDFVAAVWPITSVAAMTVCLPLSRIGRTPSATACLISRSLSARRSWRPRFQRTRCGISG